MKALTSSFTLAVFASQALSVVPVQAQPLPSQLADVATDFSSPGCAVDPSNSFGLNTLQKADGTTAPFEIPAGQVFVVTAVELAGNNLMLAGHR